jgi:two-component system, NarL family, nitrate/nitrite response regulator NarL
MKTSAAPPATPRTVSPSITATTTAPAVKTGATRRIRLLLADDHPVVRKGLLFYLESRPNLEIVGEAANGREALQKARESAPDVIVSDLNMPQINGLDLTEALRKELPKTRILILSSHSNSEQVIRILRSGAHGYVLKDASPDELWKAIETVNGGDTYFTPEVARIALNQFVRKDADGPQEPDLTVREQEVLTHIAEGLSNKEIACRLNLGTRTIETHRERLMTKLNIHSVAGLTKFAIVKGFISFPCLPVPASSN